MNARTIGDIDSWLTSNEFALLVLTTPDCGVCDAIRPKVAEIAARYPTLRVRYVDLTETPEAAGRFGVFVVPVLILFVQGRESVRFARHFGMGELESAVLRYSSLMGGT